MNRLGKYALCLLSGVMLGSMLTIMQFADLKEKWVIAGKMPYLGSEYRVVYQRPLIEEDDE